MNRLSLAIAGPFLVSVLATTGVLALADATAPSADERSATRMVRLPASAGAPVIIDYAYVNLRTGADGKRDSLNASCIRYRNVAREPLTSVRFARTYFDARGRRLGGDATTDATLRAPNAAAKPGSVPVAASYWNCSQSSLTFGAKVETAAIAPVIVKFRSGKTWRAEHVSN